MENRFGGMAGRDGGVVKSLGRGKRRELGGIEIMNEVWTALRSYKQD